MITLTSTDAQNRFGEVMDTAQREPIIITRRGRPLVFIISPDELNKLFSSQERRDEAVASYEAYIEKVRDKINPSTNQLIDEVLPKLVNEPR